ncbi:MAG TPA: tRNA (adenosine(37)-N6)-threonylcarbamoyltransferase complex dimerization subunit type 1 TsaB [Pyrinomonadaceae bacterium]|jgi:tRNA threonylcarbamoyladenosine biosynthesis protein TsaB|nr:tRNA (adenosine(37)-N6)-threonylcarbamoyltransferase complex dimerization subunit type 1 TsaB [Pyrinomonadaceae bacterium]
MNDSTDDSLTPSTAAAPFILSLDTATAVRSVAVARGERVLASFSGRVQKENSARVLQDVDEALTAASVKLGDIELFAVAAGPGSFTGLRSGIATIKAFAATLGRPVAAVPTLHAVAASCGTGGRVLASLPAGRGEVFAQLLSVEREGVVTELSEPFHLSPAALLEKAAQWGGDLIWAGAGAHAHVAAIREFAEGKRIGWRDEVVLEDGLTGETGEGWTLAPLYESYAEQIAALGLINYRQGSTIVAEDLYALYVRLSDAELNERCRR